MRHNVWYSDDNTEADLNRRRMLYVLGKMIDLEYALRGVAEATQKADYAVEMAKRAKRALAFLNQIDESIDNPELSEIISIGSGAKLSLNNSEALQAAATEVKAQAQSFANSYDGSGLSGIDASLPTPDKYRGDVFSG